MRVFALFSPHRRILFLLVSLGLFCTLALSGCSLALKFDDNGVLCESDDDCKDGLACSHDNICRPVLLQEPCTESFGSVDAPNAFNIGVILHLSGEGSGFGQPMRDAILLATEDFSAGVSGRPLGLIFCDTQGSTERAFSGATHLVENAGVQAIIGMNSTQLIEIANQIAIPNDVLLMSPSATAAQITNLDDKSLVWRTAPSDAVQVQALGQLVNHVINNVIETPVSQAKITLLIRENDRWAEGLRDALTNELPSSIVDGNRSRFSPRVYPVFSEGQNADYSQFITLLEEESVEPDIVVVLGSFDAWQLVEELDDVWNDKKPLYFFADAARNTEQAASAPASLVGRIWGTAPQSVSENQQYQPYRTFRTRYNSKYNAEVDEHAFAPNAFDALYLIGFAASSQGFKGPELARGLKTLSEGWQKALEGEEVETILPTAQDAARALRLLSENKPINYQGASGKIQFDSNGDPLPSPIALWCLDTEGTVPSIGTIYNPDGAVFTPRACPHPLACESNNDCQKHGEDWTCSRSNMCMPMKLEQPCDEYVGPSHATDVFQIGVMLPLSGDEEDFGKPLLDAILLAQADFNDNADNDSSYYHIGLVLCDTQGRDRLAIEGAQFLVDELDIQAIIGPDYSNQTIDVAQEITIDAGVLLMSPSATAAAISELDDNDLVWRTAPSDEVQGEALGQLVRYVLNEELEKPLAEIRMALLERDQDAYVQGLGQALRARLPEDVVSADQERFFQASYPNSSAGQGSDYSAVISEVVAHFGEHDPDIVIVLGSSEAWDITESLDRALNEPNTLYFFADAAKNSPRAESATANLHGRIWGTAPQNVGDRSYPPYTAFSSKFDSVYGHRPDQYQFVANAFDALYLVALAGADNTRTGHELAQAMRRFSDLSAELIRPNQPDARKAISLLRENKTINFEGASGVIQFDENGDPAPDPITLWCLQDGNLPEVGVVYTVEKVFQPQSCAIVPQ